MRVANRWIRNSVGTKFALLTTACTGAVVAVSVMLLMQHFGTQDDLRAKQAARETTARLGAAVDSVFQAAFEIVGTTNANLVALKEDGITDPKAYDTMLKQMVEAQPNRFGAWLVWDANDAPTKGDSSAGDLSVYWHQNGMELLRDTIPREIIASDLYKVPYREHKPYLLEPHAINAVAGDTTLVTSFAKPLEQDGTTVGVITLDVKLDAIADAIGAIDIPAGASITVVSDGGVVAMSTTKALAGKPLQSANSEWVAILDKAKRDGDGSHLSFNTDGSTEVLTSWSAIHLADVKNPWYLLMQVPEQSLIATTSNDRVFLLVIATGALLSVLLVVLLAMNRIVATPLQSLSTIISGLGAGLFDFDIPCRDRTDEVGDIARAVESLQASGLEIARLHEASGEAEYRRLLDRRSELDGISCRFSGSIASLVAELEKVAATVETRSIEVSTSSQGALERLDEVAKASRVAHTEIGSVAKATDALTMTIDAIGERTRNGRAATDKVERHTAVTETALEQLKKTISDIEGVARLVSEVAAQINLIALNATIEAARAGEAGRGFAVVAQEIKVLATRTAKATEEIGSHIAAVQRASHFTDTSVVEMREAFAEMRTTSAEIAGALDVQFDATNEISRLIQTALTSGKTVTHHAEDLKQSSMEVRQAANVMNSESGLLGEQILRLDGEVKSFLGFLKAS